MCLYGVYDNYTVTFTNLLPYSIDVIWINGDQKEVVYAPNLANGTEYSHLTYFTHNWIFKESGTSNRLFAEANGVKEATFEGCHFGAPINSIFHVAIVGTGKF